MIDLKNIAILCISLLLIYKFIISPVLSIINPASRLYKIKSMNQKMGNAILLFDHGVYYSRKYVIFLLISIVITIALTIFLKLWILSIFSILFVSFLLTMVANNKYRIINGVYDNGIVLNDSILWSDLHSWKIINKDKISILKKNGSRFDIEINDKSVFISGIMVKKGINEE